jgi:uncharacterized protein
MNKLDRLKELLAPLGRLCVCYSGGVDSAFLLKVAYDVLGEGAFAVVADTALLPRTELAEAAALAESIGAACLVIKVDALAVPEVRRNDRQRCYHCKKNLYARIRDRATALGADAVADGKNADDAAVHRPGARAADELGVLSPLCEAGLTKEDIRRCSRRLGLPTWDKPANACLATRLPYDTEVTSTLLEAIENAEELLHARGYHAVRVRVHDGGTIARVEAPLESLPALAAEPGLSAALGASGFRYVTLDMEGLRSGSMDDEIQEVCHGHF